MTARPSVQTLGPYPVQIWGGLGAFDEQVLVQNFDTQNPLYVGYTAGCQVQDSVPVAPGASILIRANIAMWAFTLATEPVVVIVAPGLFQFNLGPAQILETIDIAGLAAAIAEAIATTGVSLISNPVQLYQGAVNPAPNAGQVGSTVSGASYNLGGGDAHDITAAQMFDGFVGRIMGMAACKVYYQEGKWDTAWPTTVQDVTTRFNNGIQLVISVKPGRDPTKAYTNPNQVSSAPSGATLGQEKASLAAMLALFSANGLNSSNCYIVAWNESNDPAHGFATGADYIAWCNYYGPTINAAGFLFTYNPLLAFGNIGSRSGGYYPGDTLTKAVLVDYYAWDYFKGTNSYPGSNGGATLTSAHGDNPMALADNNVNGPVPFGVAETGQSDGSNAPTNSDFANWYTTTLCGVMAARLAAGKTNGPVIWFDEAPPPANNGIDGSTPAVQIAAMQRGYDSISARTLSGVFTVNPGATVNVPPLNPSVGGGFAMLPSLSYEGVFRLQAGGGSTVPFANLHFQWHDQDQPNDNPIAQQAWQLPMSTTAPGSTITAKGPADGQFLQVSVTNHDTVAMTLQFSLTATGRQVDKHDWRWDSPSSPTIPGYSAAGGAPNANSLGSLGGSIGPGANALYILSLFAGEIWFRWTSTSNLLTASFVPQPASVFGSSPIWASTANTQEDIIILPRGCIGVLVGNTDSVAHTFTLAVIGLDP